MADPTLTALLRAICAAPADLSTRLIYADRCEEVGDVARAEFVRVQVSKPLQCEWMTRGLACAEYNQDVQPYRVMVRCPPCAERDQLNNRERELFDSFGLADRRAKIFGLPVFCWVDDVPMKPDSQVLRDHTWSMYCLAGRGFPEVISCTCADWQAHGPQIVLQTPVTEVRLTDLVVSQYPYDGSGYRSDPYEHWGTFAACGMLLTTHFDTEQEARRENERRSLTWARDKAELPRWEGTR